MSLNLNGQATNFSFEWRPLTANGEKCYIWQYGQVKSGSDLPVVYRHVLDMPNIGIVSVYVGEGESLNGPAKRNLVFQYGGHGETRIRVKSYLQGRHETGWTDILELFHPLISFNDSQLRKFVEDTFIVAYFWEHQRLLALKPGVPDFLNKP